LYQNQKSLLPRMETFRISSTGLRSAVGVESLITYFT
jgi:hypothetical protein